MESNSGAGYQALVLTVDAPILGQRERDIHNNMINFQDVYYPKAFAGNAAHTAAGASGVQHVLEILREELRIAMILSGCSKVSNISRTIVA